MSAAEHSAFRRVETPAIPDQVRDDAGLRVGDGLVAVRSPHPLAPSPEAEGEFESILVLPPLAPTRHRADGWTPARQRGFLEALATCGSVAAAAQSVGMTREGAYALRRRADARGFAQAWEAARLLATDHLIDLAWDRATAGELRQIFYHGELVGETRQFDNRLLLSLIAQNRALLAQSEAAAAAPAPAPAPAVIAAVVADWEAALVRAERGEALGAADLRRLDLSAAELAGGAIAAPDADAIEPPLPPATDCHGAPQSEAQLLEIGLFQHWWAARLDCWLTNWPAPADWQGREYRLDARGEPELLAPGAGAGADDADGADGAEWPDREHYARTLTPEEEVGVASGAAGGAAARARRLELYRRAAFGLASAAERGSLAAANDGRTVSRQR